MLTKEQKEVREELIENGVEEAVIDAYASLVGEEYIEDIEEAYQGKWASDEWFVQELLDGTGELPTDLPAYIHIDWESTARDIMMDYMEQDGHYFRCL